MAKTVGESRTEFTARARDCFRKNGGKLFLVDDVKYNALEVLLLLVSEEKPQSILLIAEDVLSAREEADLFQKNGIASTLVCGADQAKALFGEGDCFAYAERAKTFAQRCPVLVLSAKDKEGESLLHLPLAENLAKSGTFFSDEGGTAAYCVSDFLSDCRYAFVAADSVYSLIYFRPKKEDENPKPAEFDRMDFLGQAYYSDVKHSYRRLKNVVSGAEKCVLIADNIVERRAVELYAVLRLLHDPFNFILARETARSRTDDYDSSCEILYNYIINCKEDESILSACLRHSAEGKQRTPRDVYAMGEYLSENLKYLSEEEIFVGAVDAFAKAFYGGEMPALEVVAESVESNYELLAQCLCGMFFSDPVKGELESALETPRVCRMTAEESAAMLRIFGKYGVCRRYRNPKACEIARIHRDDTGFGYCLDGHFEPGGKDADYSVLMAGEMERYRILALDRILQKAGGSALVVVADGKADLVKKNLAERRAGETAAQKPAKPASAKEDAAKEEAAAADASAQKETPAVEGVSVLGFSRLRRIARQLPYKTVVFYHFPADVYLFVKLLHKVGETGARVIVLADYVGLSGLLVNDWRKDLLDVPCGTLPFGMPEAELRNTVYSYPELIGRLDELYTSFRTCAENGIKGACDFFREKFIKLRADLGSYEALASEEVDDDLRFFSEIADPFRVVFSNTLSVGRKGEQVVDVAYRKGKAELTEQDRRIFFNVCPRFLLRTCETDKNNCNGCFRYNALKRNDFSELKRATIDFFNQSALYADWRRARAAERSGGRVISGSPVDNELEGFADLVGRQREVAEQALSAIDGKVRDAEGPASVPYEDVAKVLDAVKEVYLSIALKYFSQVEDLISVTDKNMQASCAALLSAAETAGLN